MRNVCLAIEGHDGAGKSSLARGVATRLGAAVAKPFKDSLGDFIAWLWRTEQFEFADLVARQAVVKVLQEIGGDKAVVFDRHWLTMFTVLPEALHPNWFPLPKTVLCWADLKTTLARLRERDEEIGDVTLHQHYLDRYRQLAGAHGVPILDTSGKSVDETASLLLEIVTGRAV